MKVKLLGSVSVDSGTLLIGDPCYHIENVFDEAIDGDGVIHETAKAYGARDLIRLASRDMMKDNLESVSVPHMETGDPGLATLFGGFGGDGLYPVYGVCADPDNPDLITGAFVDFGNPGAFRFALIGEIKTLVSEHMKERIEYQAVEVCPLPDPEL